MIKAFRSLAPFLEHFGQPVFSGDSSAIDRCPGEGGVYLLAIALDQPIALSRPEALTLPAGLYLYAGSAHGPGGLHARLKRHLASSKKVRWHVDQLTTRATHTSALAWLRHKECDLIAALQQAPSCTHPVKGMGSSDCRHCMSHVLHVQI